MLRDHEIAAIVAEQTVQYEPHLERAIVSPETIFIAPAPQPIHDAILFPGTIYAARREGGRAISLSKTIGSVPGLSPISVSQDHSENHSIGADSGPAISGQPIKDHKRVLKRSGQRSRSPQKANAAAHQLPIDGHSDGEPHLNNAVAADDEASQVVVPTSPLPVIGEIIQLWRMRQRWHRAEKSLILQGKALCRSWSAGDKDVASRLFDDIQKGQEADATLTMALMPFPNAIETFEPQRAAIEKRLKKSVKQLPVWPWVGNIKGFGPLNFAALVGECGDIGSYKSPAALWKRMGLAVMSDGRQRRVAGDAAIEHGYNAARRAVAWNLGETLIKSGDKCIYRPMYAARKEYELPRVKDSKAHAHNRAARYMVKRVLRDLWAEWRRASAPQLEGRGGVSGTE